LRRRYSNVGSTDASVRREQAAWAAREELGDRLAVQAEAYAVHAKETAAEHERALTKTATMLEEVRMTPAREVNELEAERSASRKRFALRALETAAAEELAEGAT
jgi:hypothetical protein